MQYEVTVVIDASRSATVEADSPAEAADKALEEHGFPSICHQCAGELNVGDAVGAIVYDSERETQLLDTTYHGERIAELEAEIARLRAAHTPPAQAADSVLEDAARYRYLRDVPMGLWPAELLSAIRLQQNAKWDAAIDAARKQGANHD